MKAESDVESALWLQKSGTRPSKDAISQDLQEAIDYCKGSLPEPDALAWYAWMAGLVEYDLLPLADFEELSKLLPSIEVEKSLQKFLNPHRIDRHRLSCLNDFESTFADLKARIGSDISDFGGSLPILSNVAWTAYLAGLVEFGVVLLDHQAYFVKHFLPSLYENREDDPVYNMLFGRS